MSKTGNGKYGSPRPGFFEIGKFGRNGDVDTGALPEDIWDAGGLYPFLAGPDSLEILSSSVNDIDAGSGANLVEIEGLDANWDIKTEIITMNGLGIVAIPGTFIRINRAKVLTSGALGSNEGLITIRINGAGNILATIPVIANKGSGQTLQAIYSVPSGKKAKIVRHWARLDKFPGTNAQLRILTRAFGGAWQTKETFPISDNLKHDVPANILISEKSDIRIEVFDVGANDVVIDAGFDIKGENL
ncbi:MAG: hypothetical protein KAI64_04725 [Thermoplasmata archaeon]|nr:hypothetical protein [Thermoplasmata archaeon]